MTPEAKAQQIIDAFQKLYSGKFIDYNEPDDDTIYVHVGDLMFRIDLPSDDDGFFYAFPFVGTDYATDVCVRIAYP